MANTFTRKLSQNVGTSAAVVGNYTVGSSTVATVIGLSLCNKKNTEVRANVILSNATSNTSIVSYASIPANDTLIVVGGDQKVVLVTGDFVEVQSDTSTSIDVVMSVLEIT